MTKERKFEKIGLTPIVISLKGSFSAPKNFDYKKELAKSLEKKYLNRVKRAD
jgi:hypothetical protein